MLLITHNRPLVRSVADIVVMHEGAICEQGAVNDVPRTQKDPYPARFPTDAPKMTVAVDG